MEAHHPVGAVTIDLKRNSVRCILMSNHNFFQKEEIMIESIFNRVFKIYWKRLTSIKDVISNATEMIEFLSQISIDHNLLQSFLN